MAEHSIPSYHGLRIYKVRENCYRVIDPHLVAGSIQEMQAKIDALVAQEVTIRPFSGSTTGHAPSAYEEQRSRRGHGRYWSRS